MADRPRRLLVGDGAGIGPTLQLAERMAGPAAAHDARAAHTVLVLLGSDLPFPFRPRPSVIVVPGIPADVIACMPLLEEWDIASRLASTLGLPGCFDGPVTDLADAWLGSLASADLTELEIFTCGPTPTLTALANLARRYSVPCQTSNTDAPTARN